MPRAAGLAVGAVTACAWLSWAHGPDLLDEWITPVHDPASAGLGAFAAHAAGTLRPLTKLTFAAEASAGPRRACG